MTPNNHTQNRALQRDARAWAKFTGTTYLAALRQISSPLAQGILGEMISPRKLIAVLDEHEIVGARDGDLVLGEDGYLSESPWRFNGETDFIELALITDVLRMLKPISDAAAPEVNSYFLKHTAEWFLHPHWSYVSNGRLIWAAAALGLRIAVPDDAGLNLLIGVSERGHDYVRRMVGPGQARPNAHHYRPDGYEHLQTALATAAAGESMAAGWVQPTRVDEDAPFHDWLILQIDRDDVVGDFASEYAEGVRVSHHRLAHSPDELIALFHEIPHSSGFYDSMLSAIAEWMMMEPSAVPVRTKRIDEDTYDHAGWGAGAGTVERYEYRCPCGDGMIIEEHDNVPGFREHDVHIDCDRCRAEWRFVGGRSVRDWGLEPVSESIVI